MEGLYLQLVIAPGHGRTGYVLSRKVAKRAVDRNRIRRKLRELTREMRPQLAAYDVILRVKKMRNRAEQDAATIEAARLLGEFAAGLPR
jgi:ribonuclease P protein component